MMPGRTVKQEQNRMGREQQQELSHKISGDFGGFFESCHRDLPSQAQLQCAIKMRMVALGVMRTTGV